MFSILPMAAGAVLMALVSFGLHSCDVSRLETKHQKDLVAQNNALVSQCDKDKAVTKEVSHALQNDLSVLSGQLDNARRLYHNACLSVTANSATGYDGAATSRKPAGAGAGRSEIDINKYIDFLGEGERYRVQLKACQSFVLKAGEAGNGGQNNKRKQAP